VAEPGLTHGVWLERVPELVRDCAGRWDLRLGDPYVAGAAGHTTRVELPDGTPAVLKVGYPHRESEYEAAALELLDGAGTVRPLEPWLITDPKLLVGEREFAVAPIVRSFELGDTRQDVIHRLDRLSSELGLDRERARWWTIGQTLAWAFDSSYLPRHIQTVRRLIEAG
jgi:hypothetical protein